MIAEAAEELDVTDSAVFDTLYATSTQAATRDVLGENVPIHSLKGHFGHSLGACGAIEAWLGIEMMREGWFCPTANLVNVDPRCATLDYVIGDPRRITVGYLMSNNFALGGINTSMIIKAAR